VKHRARVEQLAIEIQFAPKTREGAEVVDPRRVVEEHVRLGVAGKLGDLAAKPRVRDADAVDRRHIAIRVSAAARSGRASVPDEPPYGVWLRRAPPFAAPTPCREG
jgi:hypothetical protein